MDDRVRVLCVDDDRSFADMAANFLEQERRRFDVETVTDVEAGLDRLDQGEPPIDCVVSDYEMPGTNGLEFLKAVRAIDEELPFILFTGKGSEAIAGEALSAGVTDYLQKRTGTGQYELLANRIENAVSEHRAARRARTLERIRSLVAEVNKTLVRASSREEIEAAICRILSDAEPYRFAWIGAPDPATGRVEPRASAGIQRGYLEEISIRIDESAEGRGPMGRALRNDEFAASQNVRLDPGFERWREEAIERGFQAVAAVPLSHENAHYGGLAVYADRPNAFDETERELLVELGDDIAHALYSLETQAELEWKTRAMDEAPVGIVLTDPSREDNPIVYANDFFRELTGYPESETLGRNCRFLQGPETDPESVATMREAIDAEAPVTVELKNYRRDGAEFWNRVTIAPVRDDDGHCRHFVGFQEDITERKSVEAELRDRQAHLRQAQTVATLGSWQLDLEADTLYWSEEVYAIFDVPKDTSLSYDRFLEYVHPKDRERIETAWNAALEGEEYDIEHQIVTGSGETRWVRERAEIEFDENGDPVEALGVVQDITEQKTYERRLETLSEAMGRLHGVTTRQTVARTVTGILSETFGDLDVQVYLLEEATGTLHRVASTIDETPTGDETPSSDESVRPGVGPIGTAFLEGDRQYRTDEDGEDRPTGLVVPIEGTGAIVLTHSSVDRTDAAADRSNRTEPTTDSDLAGERTAELVEILASATRESIARIDRDRRLDRERERLREQAVELDRLDTVTRQVRRILRGLGAADGRDGIGTAVCRRLADTDEHALVWLGRVDPRADVLVPDASAGNGEAYLSAIDRSLDATGAPPAVQTARRGESVLIDNIAGGPGEQRWRREALARGYHSAVSVPVQLEEVFHGVLTIYADRPEAFDEFTRETLAELGRIVARAISHAEQRTTLARESVTEIVLEIGNDDYPWVQIADELDAELRVESTMPREDSTIAFLRAPELSSDRLVDRLQDLPIVLEAAAPEQAGTVRARIGADDATAGVVAAGGILRECEATSDGARLRADLPPDVSVRSVVDRVAGEYPDTRLLSRSSRSRENSDQVSELFDDLTRNQREALEAAFYGGFYEWPRDTTIEALAETFDLSSPTFSRHLRIGQRKLLENAFGE